MMEAIKAIVAVVAVGAVMWWIISPPSQSVGRARALIVTAGALLINCVGN